MIMKIAIPTREGMVDNHFGHCAYYTLLNFRKLQFRLVLRF